MNNQFEFSDQKEQPVISIRKTTNMAGLQQELGHAFMAVTQYLAELGETPAGPVFAAYHNMDMEHLDVEMGIPVSKPLSDRGEIKAGSIPAGKQVSTVHKGPYTQMEGVYNALTEWMSSNGHIPSGVVYEFYLNSPMEVSENELLTKIIFLVK
ncbi:MAG: AraC family transcriptional regulator [Chloroflexi bacterium HGW-Chloroflexi-4]|jgi:effector-binding domain-containing protein|nr:MAG: AraC family transcriptional regulator [Chloroflexi bacterium HGW-Chloroflexi-4]